MADWRQIQARIRKAKLSPDPVATLSELFGRTRDGMAAFELARLHELAERKDEALNWYTWAWHRFRRATWRHKAAEGIERLGGAVPQEGAPEPADMPRQEPAGHEAHEAEAQGRFDLETASESDEAGERGAGELAASSEASEAAGAMQAESGGQPGAPGKKRSRRGRRGGRRHRRKRERAAQGQPQAQAATTAPAEAEAAVPPAPREPERERERERERDRGRGRDRQREHRPPAAELDAQLFDRQRVGSEFAAQARTGDPALASRMAKLESMLRRLMASPVYSMSEIETAPAGPGVFVLSDSDQVTYYYVEACRTLRIAITNIARARAGEGSIKRSMADHLGISETQVGKYIKEHCVVRWLQLDEGAARLAHFAIAVLGPALNE
jgi:hypothetical protein